MLCKNCNYIITGKENFCPNCASPVGAKKAEETPDIPTEKPEQVTEYKAPPTHRHERIFSDKSENLAAERRASIFYEPPEIPTEKPNEKNKSYAGRIMFLLFLTCVFVAGAFAVADYFGITSSVFGFIETATQPQQELTEESSYRDENSILKPDVSFSPVTAYVMSGKGMTLRKGPGNSYAPIANIADLTQVQIYGESLTYQGWVYAYCPETESYGWLDGSFLMKESEEEKESETTAVVSEEL